MMLAKITHYTQTPNYGGGPDFYETKTLVLNQFGTKEDFKKFVTEMCLAYRKKNDWVMKPADKIHYSVDWEFLEGMELEDFLATFKTLEKI